MELTETTPEPEAIEETAPAPADDVAPETASLEADSVAEPEDDAVDAAAAKTEPATTQSSDGFRAGHGEGTNDNDSNDIVLFELDIVVDPDGDNASKPQIGKQ